MVSRSDDGELLIPSLLFVVSCRFVDRTATIPATKADSMQLRHWSSMSSGAPGYLAVDGPRGPRNRVHKELPCSRNGLVRGHQYGGCSFKAMISHTPGPLSNSRTIFHDPRLFRRADFSKGKRKRGAVPKANRVVTERSRAKTRSHRVGTGRRIYDSSPKVEISSFLAVNS